jgi:hypothetical protein
MLTFPRPKQLATAFGALLICCLIACSNGAPVQTSDAGDLQGTWKVTGTEEAKGLSKEKSELVGMMLAFDPDTGDRTHLFTKDECIVSDSAGKELHRWPYKLDGDLMVTESDTATVMWTGANSFTLVADSVFCITSGWGTVMR